MAVVIYKTERCPYCKAAISLLDQKNVTYEIIDLDAQPELRLEMEQLSGRRTVPQIFINNKPIGGFDDLRQLNSSGELDNLLNL